MSLSKKPSEPARVPNLLGPDGAGARSRLNVEVSKSLHLKFKTSCAADDTPMRDVIEDAMLTYINGYVKLGIKKTIYRDFRIKCDKQGVDMEQAIEQMVLAYLDGQFEAVLEDQL